MLFELVLEPVEKREGVRRGPGKPGHDLAFGNPTNLSGLAFHDRLAE